MKSNQILSFNYKRIILVLLPLVLAGVYFIFIYRRPVIIIPESKKTEFDVIAVSDKVVGGQTEINIVDTTEFVSYSYELKEGYKYNFANITLGNAKDSLFDFSNYGEAIIKIKAIKGTRIPFMINVLDSDIKLPDGSPVYRPLQKNLNVNSQVSAIKVKLDELDTPDWWYTDNNFREDDFKSVDFSHVKGITFANCINLGQNKKDTVTIEELSFHFDFLPYIIKTGVFFILYYLLFFFVDKRKKNEKISVSFNYDKIESENYQSKEEAQVFGYLASNYSKQDLVITDLQSELGIHEKKISSIIKAKSGLNFKQFLNQLRLSEAKRLLKSSDLPIAEIAFKVGYSNSTHFNRVFKALENRSPNEYRKNEG